MMPADPGVETDWLAGTNAGGIWKVDIDAEDGRADGKDVADATEAEFWRSSSASVLAPMR